MSVVPIKKSIAFFFFLENLLADCKIYMKEQASKKSKAQAKSRSEKVIQPIRYEDFLQRYNFGGKVQLGY